MNEPIIPKKLTPGALAAAIRLRGFLLKIVADIDMGIDCMKDGDLYRVQHYEDRVNIRLDQLYDGSWDDPFQKARRVEDADANQERNDC